MDFLYWDYLVVEERVQDEKKKGFNNLLYLNINKHSN